MIQPKGDDLAAFAPRLTIVDLPSFQADPKRHGTSSPTVIACDMSAGMVLIGGTSYAGEMKKSVFSVLNYLLPQKQVMPMHCSANVGRDGDTALFFGLSGTGKTTLSADTNRILIGDDEHGWSEHGIFNFEGGCYAKVIRLSKEAEPEIFGATQQFATVLENVVLDPASRAVKFDDGSLTENTRAAYPLSYIPNASESGTAGHPKTIIMLTPARKKAFAHRKRHSPPVSARLSCRVIRPSTARSCAGSSAGTEWNAGWSIPDGRAAAMGWASGCRSKSPGRCLPPRSRASWIRRR
jgi:phosphoenolpyruvate carboxykinase (ATP)